MYNFNKKINEAMDRQVTYNPFDLFFSKKIVPGSFVTVGYIKDANEESGKPKVTGRKNFIPENDEKLQSYLQEYVNTMWAADFAQILSTPGYAAALEGKKKTADFTIDGHVVRVQKFQYNWREPQNLGKAFAGKEDEIVAARANAGFGQGVNDWDADSDEDFFDDYDDSYAEDDWRRKSKYQGTGLRPRLKSNAPSSGYRFPTAAPGLYSYSGKDESKYNSMAIRNMLDPRISDPKAGFKSVYYYVAPNGMMEEMPIEFINFIRDAYKGSRNTKPTEPDVMTDAEEIEFNKVIAEIEAKYAGKQQPTDLLFDNILYISTAPADWNDKKVRTPMVFINNRAIYQEYPFLRSKELNKVIVQFCTDVFPLDRESKRTLSKAEQIARRADKIERVTEQKKRSVNPKHQKLYESIMMNVSKNLKKQLNIRK